jgi:hypothetical protein
MMHVLFSFNYFVWSPKNGSQAANQRFFAFPEIRLFYGNQIYLSLILFLTKKTFSGSEPLNHFSVLSFLIYEEQVTPRFPIGGAVHVSTLFVSGKPRP